MEIDRVSEFLRNARVRSNVSQEEAAEAIGVKRSTIGNYESGKSVPDMDKFVALCKLYGEDYLRAVKLIFSENFDRQQEASREELMYALNIYLSGLDIKYIRAVEWILSGRHGVRVMPLIDLIITYLHLDLYNRFRTTENVCEQYEFLRIKDELCNRGVCEPDVVELTEAIKDAREAHRQGLPNYENDDCIEKLIRP